ncbi:MAG: beta-propeller fold lactonase family protein, partial [Planctomycetota bacterium]|nr:beta-propeller fold lactonase family protein [Planctomycetota bacterium]
GVSSDNRSVYVPYVKEENALYQYRFDPETGKLSPGAPANIEIPDAVGPRHLAFHPTKPYVYFSNEQQLGVSAYKIGPRGGLQQLQICAALETPPAEGLAASDIVITPDGRFLYVPVRGFGKPLNAVFGYAIGAGGRLKSLGMTATDSIPWALGMSPHGDHLFVTSSKQGSLAAYAIDNKGGLKKEASVKIGERFWDILVLGDTSE